jgi:hypothetical protein
LAITDRLWREGFIVTPLASWVTLHLRHGHVSVPGAVVPGLAFHLRLSRLYGRGVNELIRDREVTEEFAIQFRAAIAQADRHHTELERAIQEYQQLCEDYLELERLCGAPLTRNYPSPYSVEGISPEEAAEDIASAERNRLGLGDGPILRLREILESDIGLRSFYPRLPSHIAGMFAYTERVGGCID